MTTIQVFFLKPKQALAATFEDVLAFQETPGVSSYSDPLIVPHHNWSAGDWNVSTPLSGFSSFKPPRLIRQLD
jgi:hypothetical protein